jgi:hypothetical protein
MVTEVISYTAKAVREDIKENDENIARTKINMANANQVRQTALEQKERYNDEIKKISDALRYEKNKDKKIVLWTELESYQNSLKIVEQVLQTSYVETQADLLNSLSIFTKSRAIGERVLRTTESNVSLPCSYSYDYRLK